MWFVCIFLYPVLVHILLSSSSEHAAHIPGGTCGDASIDIECICMCAYLLKKFKPAEHLVVATSGSYSSTKV